MAFSHLPLSYCANVHPGETYEEVHAGLARYAAAVRSNLGRPMAAGLWMTSHAIQELRTQEMLVEHLQQSLRDAGLVCYTMNAFPLGNFHARRVKENVYLPDWTSELRRDYTLDVAWLLARLLPADVEGSISTSPCAFKPALKPAQSVADFFPKLVDCALGLSRLETETGRTIRLAIEPEPGCVLETTDEVLDFFPKLWAFAAQHAAEEVVRRHVGICYDVCHQAVEFEDVATSIDRMDQAGIRIQKVHVTCALELDDPRNDDARAYLGHFAEERYLHQTYGQHPSGRILRLMDLTRSFSLEPEAEWLECPKWRIHFHVPVDRLTMGPLQTTRPILRQALERVYRLPYQPHLEVETYTWNVLPRGDNGIPSFDLVDGLTREMQSTYRLLEEIAPTPE